MLLGGQEKRKAGNHGKVGVERKWWVLAQPPYPQQENGGQSRRVEPFNQGDRPLDAEENPGSQYHRRLEGQARAWAHSTYIHIKLE